MTLTLAIKNDKCKFIYACLIYMHKKKKTIIKQERINKKALYRDVPQSKLKQPKSRLFRSAGVCLGFHGSITYGSRASMPGARS